MFTILSILVYATAFLGITLLPKTLLFKVTQAAGTEFPQETWLYIGCICTLGIYDTYILYMLLNCLTHIPHILLLCIWYDMKVVGDTYLNETLTMRFKFPFHLFLIFQTKRLMFHTQTYTKWLLHVCAMRGMGGGGVPLSVTYLLN